ncbi:hypothetical protein [Salinifilum ghardaiensis]
MYRTNGGGAEPGVFVTAIPERHTAEHIAVQLFDDGFVAASWVEETTEARWTTRQAGNDHRHRAP